MGENKDLYLIDIDATKDMVENKMYLLD